MVVMFNFLIHLEQNSLSQGQQYLDVNSDVLMAEGKVQDNVQNFITLVNKKSMLSSMSSSNNNYKEQKWVSI